MRGKHSPRLAPVAVLAATEPDVDGLRRGLGFDASEHRRLFISRLYTAAGRDPDVPERLNIALEYRLRVTQQVDQLFFSLDLTGGNPDAPANP